MELFLENVNSTPVFKSNLLPYEQTYKACDISTKEEINILTGELVECFEMNGKIYLSPKRYEQLKNHLK